MKPVSIIGMGMGRQDLTAKHLSIIAQADILVGGRRLLENFKDLQVQRKPIGKNIDEVIDFVKEKSKHHKIVVLTSGDPLFYGIGAKMAGALDANQIRIYPNINSVAAAFARLKEPWDNAAVISLHGRQNEARLYGTLEKENKIAVFTDPKKNPAWLAARLIAKEFTHFKMCVLEALGSGAERFDWYTLQKAAKMKFAEPNMVVLKRSPLESDPKPKLYLGAPDSWYDHQGGLITKSEIRAITLSKLQLEPHHILWDLGAGSGAISIEAALFAKRGKILAVEQDPARIEHIKNNKKRFNIGNLKIVQAILPKGLSTLPRPDRIFIGGGGKNLKTIVMQAAKHLKPGGRIVINTVLLPNLQVAKSALDQLRFETNVIQVQINRSRQMPWAERFEAQNPVWIISGFRISE
ncbi:MAG: precorrin-6y C5,15-methyltransferase (decarboxylating) subunit CbiE [Desulfobacterales bacterium]|jgi:precorrin-6Y C5,15-methyltransferase (decarboxylating)